jgi:hypothetical protein
MKTLKASSLCPGHQPGWLLPIVLALFLAGCASVHTPRPIGEKPHALVKSEWEGTWTLEKKSARITVTDAANGWITITSFKEPKPESDAPTPEILPVQIMETGDWLIANVRDQEASTERYTWGRIRLSGDDALVWTPDVSKFRALVQEHKLPGRIEGDDVALEAPTTADLHALVSGALGVPFDWEGPYTLHRVSR